MKKRLIVGFEILLALGLVVGLAVVIHQASDYKKGQQDYDEAEQLANLPDEGKIAVSSAETVRTGQMVGDPYGAMLKETIDLTALKEINSDVSGWINIPGTELSYPILQGEDNDYYLNHTWKGEPNSMGSVFLECQVDPELADFNTIIYGHRLRNLSMFGSLKFYEDISYWEENPSVYIVIEENVYRYDIYAAYKADPEDIIYGLKINSRPKKQELIQFGLEHSVIDTGITPTTFDRILTLSTCTGNSHATRWVVQALYRVEASEMPTGAEGSLGGMDDGADGSVSDSMDSLTFTDTAGSIRQQKQRDSDTSRAVFLTIILVLFVVLESVLITAAFLYFRSQKNS